MNLRSLYRTLVKEYPKKTLIRSSIVFIVVDNEQELERRAEMVWGCLIAKQLVENYKGRILAESVVGQGTIFRIFIPIARTEDKLRRVLHLFFYYPLQRGSHKIQAE